MAWALRPPSSPEARLRVEPPGFLVSGKAPAFGAHSPPMNAASLKQNKWVRRGVVALLVLLVVWVLAWLAVPPIAKSQIQKIASEKLGRQVTVGKIDFKPWTLELALNDLRIATADGSQPQVAIAAHLCRRRTAIDPAPGAGDRCGRDRFAGDPADAPGRRQVRHRRHPGQAGAAPSRDAPKSEPPRFAIYNIAITGGSVDFDDQTVKRKHELRDFVLNVPFLSNLASQREIKTEPKLAFVLNGSKFDSAALHHALCRKPQDRRAAAASRTSTWCPTSATSPAACRSRCRPASSTPTSRSTSSGPPRRASRSPARSARTASSWRMRKGRDLLGFDSLKIALADVRPLERVVHLGEVALAAPRPGRGARRRRAAQSAGDRPGHRRARKGGARSPRRDAERRRRKPAEPQPWRIQVDKVALTGGADRLARPDHPAGRGGRREGTRRRGHAP